MNYKAIKIEDFNYELPEEKIAFFPEAVRDQSKLLVYKNGITTDRKFHELPDLLTNEHLLVFNNSKVIHARFLVKNKTGASIEIFLLEPILPTVEISKAFQQTGEVTWKCFIGNAKKWKQNIDFEVTIDGKKITIEAEKRLYESSFEVTFRWKEAAVTLGEWIEAYGKMPLPPYIKREVIAEDNDRYQTIFAKDDGSVAAPTAGLHFTPTTLNKLNEKGIKTTEVTLHVGAGTFKPVSTEIIGEHYMHREQLILTRDNIAFLLENINKKWVAVGTTVTRTLESLYIIGAKLKLGIENPQHVNQWEVYENKDILTVTPEESLGEIMNFLDRNGETYLHGSTAMIILPNYKPQLVKSLITNFHQPKSTLLLLVSAYLGEKWKDVYVHALQNNSRFLSFGDSNFYEP